MKRFIASGFAISLALGTSACMMGEPESSTQETKSTFSETSLYEGKECELVYHATQNDGSDLYEIWDMGTHAVLEDEEYNIEERPDLYAIFVPSVPSRLVHHVDGFSAQDHYHVMNSAPGDSDYTNTWDVLVVVPGDNFDPENYDHATSEDELLQQIDQGILAGPYPTTAVGSEPLVLHAPLTECGGKS